MPKTTTADGIALYYEVVGEGPPLLLISGTGHDHTFWSGQVPRFAESFRCIVFDNRGVGSSSAPGPGYTLAEMAEDAVAVLEAAGVGAAHVMGFSMGGHIAQEMALHHAERVLSLGLHHTWSRPCARLVSFQQVRRRLAALGDMETIADFSLLGLHAHGYFDEHAAEMDAKRRWLAEESGSSTGWEGQLEACIEGDTFDRIGAITAPTLITASDGDLLSAPIHAREMQAQIAGSRLVVMEGTGHVALIERPDEFAEVCLSFLREVTSAATAGTSL